MSKKKGKGPCLPPQVQCDACGKDTRSKGATKIKASLKEMTEDALYEGSSASATLFLCPACALIAKAAQIAAIKRIQKSTVGTV